MTARRSHVDLVLVGHLAFPALDPSGRPATISGRRLTRGLLRQRLGFDGVVITDALNMGAASPRGAVLARSPYAPSQPVSILLLMPPQPAEAVRTIVDAVHAGRLTEARIDASVEQILRLKQRLGLYRVASALPSC